MKAEEIVAQRRKSLRTRAAHDVGSDSGSAVVSVRHRCAPKLRGDTTAVNES
jgi:hypothetical protein